jgi:hypothetical protein
MKPIKFNSEDTMRKINRFKVFSFFLVASYLLAACSGTLPGSTTSAGGSKVEANVVAFTGIVEAIEGNEWTVNGQKLTIDPATSLDPNIAVGDEVKVEANLSADGRVIALKVESSVKDNGLSKPATDANNTSDPVSASSPDANAALNASSTSSVPQASGANESEVFGTVQAVTADTITVNGVAYSLANFTEFKDVIGVGDQVKLHVIVNADGTFTVREIEKSLASFEDKSRSSGSDDGPNHDLNDDHSHHSSNDDSGKKSDDHGGHDANDNHSGDDKRGSGG